MSRILQNIFNSLVTRITYAFTVELPARVCLRRKADEPEMIIEAPIKSLQKPLPTLPSHPLPFSAIFISRYARSIKHQGNKNSIKLNEKNIKITRNKNLQFAASRVESKMKEEDENEWGEHSKNGKDDEVKVERYIGQKKIGKKNSKKFFFLSFKALLKKN